MKKIKSLASATVVSGLFALSPLAPAAAQTAPEGAAAPARSLAGSYLSGQFAHHSGQLDDAVENLQHVHQQQPENQEVAGQLLGILLTKGDMEPALRVARSMENEDEGGDTLAGLLLTVDEIRGGHLDAAGRRLDTVYATGAVQLWQPLLQGWIDVHQHKLARPMTAESFTADIGRASPLVHYHMALINSAGGFKEEAAHDFQQAIENPETSPERAMRQLVMFYEAHGRPASLTPLVDRFRAAHPAEGPLKAQPVDTMAEGVTEVLYTMGGVMLAAGVTSDAVIYMQLALYMTPGMLEAQLALATAYADMRQYDQSNAIYAGIPESSPLYGKAQLQIVINDERTGQMDTALARLDGLSKNPANFTEAMITRGDLLRLHQRYGEAVEAYTLALDSLPELSPGYWPVLFARGSCYERSGRWELAEADLRHALALKPGQPDVMNYLGYSMIEHDENLKEARGFIEKAYAERPDDAQIVDSMGWALYIGGDYRSAANYLEKAVELLPADATVNEHLGDAYWRIGRKTEARFQWQQSLSFSPQSAQAESLRRKLEQGLPEAHLLPSGAGARISDATP